MSDFQEAVSNVTTGLSIVPVVLCLCFSVASIFIAEGIVLKVAATLLSIMMSIIIMCYQNKGEFDD